MIDRPRVQSMAGVALKTIDALPEEEVDRV